MKIDALDLEITPEGEVFFQGKKCHCARATRGYGEIRLPLHRLVARAFHGKPKRSTDICHHIDGNPRNNAASNLEWMTQKENLALRRFDHIRKLTPKMVADILARNPGPRVTLADMARTFGVSRAALDHVRSGHTWPHGWHKHNRGILTRAQIKAAQDWKPPVVTAAMLARQYNVSDVTILNIWHGRYSIDDHPAT